MMIYLNNDIILSQLMKFESKTLYINITEIKTIVFIRTLTNIKKTNKQNSK